MTTVQPSKGTSQHWSRKSDWSDVRSPLGLRHQICVLCLSFLKVLVREENSQRKENPRGDGEFSSLSRLRGAPRVAMHALSGWWPFSGSTLVLTSSTAKQTDQSTFVFPKYVRRPLKGGPMGWPFVPLLVLKGSIATGHICIFSMGPRSTWRIKRWSQRVRFFSSFGHPRQLLQLLELERFTWWSLSSCPGPTLHEELMLSEGA